MKKKIMAMFLAALMLISLAACQGNTPVESLNSVLNPEESTSVYDDLEAVTLIGADSTGKGTAGQMFGETVAEKVHEITKGKMTIEYYPNGEYGQDPELLEMMKNNEIQMVICQPAPMVSYVPKMAVFDMPMVFSIYDGKTIDKTLNDEDSLFYKELQQAYESSDFHLLGLLQNATFRLTTSNRPLNTWDDFVGLHIRTMENANHEAFWRSLGAEPESMEWGGVHLALKSGAIEAQENAADTIIGAYLNEVQKYLACTNHILYVNQICMNKQAYEELDPLYQQALQEAIRESIDEVGQKMKTIDEENKQILVDNGMTLIEYDNSFYEEFFQKIEVQVLIKNIDIKIGGLGTILMEELEKNAQK